MRKFHAIYANKLTVMAVAIFTPILAKNILQFACFFYLRDYK